MSDEVKSKGPIILGLNSNLNLSQTKELNRLNDLYSFELEALKDYFGVHFSNKACKTAIILAYQKVRNDKAIDDAAVIGSSRGVPEITMKALIYKWLGKNEILLGLKLDSRAGREEARRLDALGGVDDRSTIIYDKDYKDPWKTPTEY